MKLARDISLEDLKSAARAVLTLAKENTPAGAVVIALHGDLGAGKTTFVQELGRQLGVGEDITSPTFTIMKGYETTDDSFTHLIHMDAYRLEDESELAPLHFADILATPRTLFCIEWAEKIQNALPPQVLSVTLRVIDEVTRHITVD
jgi:tRNA threonylcarbamoyladenosine biosynthesis protein TsaE